MGHLIVATDKRYIKGALRNRIDGYTTAHETPPNPETETISLVEKRTLAESEERWVNLSDPLGGWFLLDLADVMEVKGDPKDGRTFVRWSYARSVINNWLSER